MALWIMVWWLEIPTLTVWGRARYLSPTEVPHNIESLRVDGEETFRFFELWATRARDEYVYKYVCKLLVMIIDSRNKTLRNGMQAKVCKEYWINAIWPIAGLGDFNVWGQTIGSSNMSAQCNGEQ